MLLLKDQVFLPADAEDLGDAKHAANRRKIEVTFRLR